MPASIGVFRNSDGSPPFLMVLTDEPVSAEYLDGRPIPLLPGDCMVNLDAPADAAEVRFRITVDAESRVLTARWPEESAPEPAPKPKRKRRTKLRAVT
jgi:hypothetical protein